MDGYKPTSATAQVVNKGYPSNPQTGHVAPTQTAPTNPPSGGSSVKPPPSPKK